MRLKNSKFKELIHKQILASRLEKLRQQHVANLSDAMEDLKKQFENKSQEAKEKLVMLQSAVYL